MRPSTGLYVPNLRQDPQVQLAPTGNQRQAFGGEGRRQTDIEAAVERFMDQEPWRVFLGTIDREIAGDTDLGGLGTGDLRLQDEMRGEEYTELDMLGAEVGDPEGYGGEGGMDAGLELDFEMVEAGEAFDEGEGGDAPPNDDPGGAEGGGTIGEGGGVADGAMLLDQQAPPVALVERVARTVAENPADRVPMPPLRNGGIVEAAARAQPRQMGPRELAGRMILQRAMGNVPGARDIGGVVGGVGIAAQVGQHIMDRVGAAGAADGQGQQNNNNAPPPAAAPRNNQPIYGAPLVRTPSMLGPSAGYVPAMNIIVGNNSGNATAVPAHIVAAVERLALDMMGGKSLDGAAAAKLLACHTSLLNGTGDRAVLVDQAGKARDRLWPAGIAKRAPTTVIGKSRFTRDGPAATVIVGDPDELIGDAVAPLITENPNFGWKINGRPARLEVTWKDAGFRKGNKAEFTGMGLLVGGAAPPQTAADLLLKLGETDLPPPPEESSARAGKEPSLNMVGMISSLVKAGVNSNVYFQRYGQSAQRRGLAAKGCMVRVKNHFTTAVERSGDTLVAGGMCSTYPEQVVENNGGPAQYALQTFDVSYVTRVEPKEGSGYIVNPTQLTTAMAPGFQGDLAAISTVVRQQNPLTSGTTSLFMISQTRFSSERPCSGADIVLSLMRSVCTYMPTELCGKGYIGNVCYTWDSTGYTNDVTYFPFCSARNVAPPVNAMICSLGDYAQWITGTVAVAGAPPAGWEYSSIAGQFNADIAVVPISGAIPSNAVPQYILAYLATFRSASVAVAAPVTINGTAMPQYGGNCTMGVHASGVAMSGPTEKVLLVRVDQPRSGSADALVIVDGTPITGAANCLFGGAPINIAPALMQSTNPASVANGGVTSQKLAYDACTALDYAVKLGIVGESDVLDGYLTMAALGFQSKQSVMSSSGAVSGEFWDDIQAENTWYGAQIPAVWAAAELDNLGYMCRTAVMGRGYGRLDAADDTHEAAANIGTCDPTLRVALAAGLYTVPDGVHHGYQGGFNPAHISFECARMANGIRGALDEVSQVMGYGEYSLYGPGIIPGVEEVEYQALRQVREPIKLALRAINPASTLKLMYPLDRDIAYSTAYVNVMTDSTGLAVDRTVCRPMSCVSRYWLRSQYGLDIGEDVPGSIVSMGEGEFSWTLTAGTDSAINDWYRLHKSGMDKVPPAMTGAAAKISRVIDLSGGFLGFGEWAVLYNLYQLGYANTAMLLRAWSTCSDPFIGHYLEAWWQNACPITPTLVDYPVPKLAIQPCVASWLGNRELFVHAVAVDPTIQALLKGKVALPLTLVDSPEPMYTTNPLFDATTVSVPRSAYLTGASSATVVTGRYGVA